MSSLALRNPVQRHCRDSFRRHSEEMFKLFESPLLYSPSHWFGIRFDVRVFVGEDFWQKNSADLSKESVDECGLICFQCFDNCEDDNRDVR